MSDRMEITEAIARKVVETVDAGLVHGKGKPIPGQMCVEAAVCFAMGLPHGDDPLCVAPILRRLKIGLNDRNWSSNQARAKGLRRLAVAQLGSAGHLDEAEFGRRVVDMTIRRSVPSALRSAAKVNPKHAEALEAAADAADARDKSLAEYAEHVVQILVAMNAPGCQWLALVPMEITA